MADTSLRKPPSLPLPIHRTLSVIAQDPSVKDSNGRILMSRIQIPNEQLDPGPIGYRVQVVDFDSTNGRYHGSHRLPAQAGAEPRAWAAGADGLLDDYRFHAQNVYALVMKTLARFERALGRRVGWSFRTHQLKVAPHGMLDANAFYNLESEGLVFGYFVGRSGRPVYTCLSHDVVVHETTHALLDAVRERYLDPSSPDQAAFHEGFADVIALLSVFAQNELVLELLRRGRVFKDGVPDDMIHDTDLVPAALSRSTLFGLAKEMGQEMAGVRGAALRQSAMLPPDPSLTLRPEFQEPHRRGELLVAAVLRAFISAWSTRVKGLATPGSVLSPLARVAEEGSDIADLMVTMWIRGLDYMPPVHIEFGDALAGVLTADAAARPDDTRHDLRRHTLESFAAFGLAPARAGEGTRGLWDAAPTNLQYGNVRADSMRSDKDEVFRFIWDNRHALELRAHAYTEVLSVRPCTRIGEDGFVLRETVAEYYQVARLTPEEMALEGVQPPAAWVEEVRRAREAHDARHAIGADNRDVSASEGLDEDPFTAPLRGGGTLIFDEFGRLKYHVHNDVFGSRQSARLLHLYQEGLLRTDRSGVRLSAGRLSTIHRMRALDARRFPKEGW